jgi:hypothetical protein
VPFGTWVQKLAAPVREGYHRHWFNDEPGRVDRALAAGYKHVLNKKGENTTIIVGRYEGGQPQIAHLMEIPDAWYKEDMEAEQKLVEEREDTIRRGRVEGTSQQEGGRYYPSAQGRGISIKRG